MPVSLATMSDGSHGLAMSSGFIDREEVRLLVWFEHGEASIAGPAIDAPKWVVKALRGVARQWVRQEPQNSPPMPTPGADDDWLDCTKKDLAVVVFNNHTVVVKKDEIFPGSGLASYRVEVAGRRRHECDWAMSVLESLADTIEEEGLEDV